MHMDLNLNALDSVCMNLNSYSTLLLPKKKNVIINKIAKAHNMDPTDMESNSSTNEKRKACIYKRENHQHTQ